MEGDADADEDDDGVVVEDDIVITGGGSSPTIVGRLFMVVEKARKINKMVLVLGVEEYSLRTLPLQGETQGQGYCSVIRGG